MLTAPIFHLCLHLGRLLEARLAAELAPFGVGQGQARVLMALVDSGPAGGAALARRLMVSPPTMTLLVRALEREGLVERRPGPDARGSGILHPTARGRAAARDVAAGWERVEADLRASAPAAEIRRRRSVLEAMRTALGGADPEGAP